MEYVTIRKFLPSEPSYKVFDAANEALASGELGESLCTFHRESVPEDEDFMISEKARWGAVCLCPYCEEWFTGGWVKGGGVRLYTGACNETFNGYCPEDCNGTECTEYHTGEYIDCPRCGERSRLISKSVLSRHGECYQRQVTEIKNVDKYTAVISWLARCKYDSVTPYGHLQIKARAAIVVDSNGKLHRFVKTQYNMSGREIFLDTWKYVKSWKDPMLVGYYSDGVEELDAPVLIYDGSDDFSGQTAEKTGLYQYLQSGGTFPNQYLRLQRRFPKIEAIIKSDAAHIIVSLIDDNVDYSIGHGIEQAVNLYDDKIFNFRENKPHRILGIEKSEMAITEHLTYEDFKCFKHISQIKKCRLADYKKYQSLLSLIGIKEIIRSCNRIDYVPNFEKIYNYISKQVKITKAKDWQIIDMVNTYCDYLQMIFQVYGSVSAELAYPKNLEAVHDDIQKKLRYISKGEAGTFEKIKEAYRALEWDDKRLCIRLPADGQELIEEGKTLRHCVGSYIQAHQSGDKTVFFVRHYRRPERSYYTLDISLINGVPVINQIHGYGNEHHGKNKEYSHTKNPEVLEFVERWRKEVLLPFFKEQNKNKLLKISKSA